MVAISPDKAIRVPTISDMVRLGMYDIQTRGIAIDPTPGNKGLQRGMKAREWATSITCFDAGRPMIRAVRDTPEEADRDARLRFMAIFDKGQKLDPVMDHPSRANKPKPATKPPAKAPVVADDDDLDDLI